MQIKLTYNIRDGFETLTFEVPESVVRFTEYTLRLNGITSREDIKKDIKKSFLSRDDIQMEIKRIERKNHTKVFVEIEE